MAVWKKEEEKKGKMSCTTVYKKLFKCRGLYWL